MQSALPTEIPQMVTFVTSIVSIAGVIVTAWFYWRELQRQDQQLSHHKQQLEEQEKQLQEMVRQRKIEEHRLRPQVEVEDYEFVNNRIRLWVSNFGEGSATSIHLRTNLAVDGSSSYELSPVSTRLLRQDDDERRRRSQSLQPHQEKVRFEADVKVGYADDFGTVHTQSIQGVLTDLILEGDVGECTLEFTIEYETVLEEPDTENVNRDSIRIDLSNRDRCSLEQAINQPVILE